MPFLDHEVQLTVDNMVTSLVCADKPMDKVSNEELGADVHNVPADGDCMLHAWFLQCCLTRPITRVPAATACQPPAEIQPTLNFSST